MGTVNMDRNAGFMWKGKSGQRFSLCPEVLKDFPGEEGRDNQVMVCERFTSTQDAFLRLEASHSSHFLHSGTYYYYYTN